MSGYIDTDPCGFLFSSGLPCGAIPDHPIHTGYAWGGPEKDERHGYMTSSPAQAVVQALGSMGVPEPRPSATMFKSRLRALGYEVRAVERR